MCFSEYDIRTTARGEAKLSTKTGFAAGLKNYDDVWFAGSAVDAFVLADKKCEDIDVDQMSPGEMLL